MESNCIESTILDFLNFCLFQSDLGLLMIAVIALSTVVNATISIIKLRLKLKYRRSQKDQIKALASKS